MKEDSYWKLMSPSWRVGSKLLYLQGDTFKVVKATKELNSLVLEDKNGHQFRTCYY